jgi:diguanylate cyclase (GGDEF)-like protein
MSDTAGNKQRLLIVDDSKVIRVTARKILQNHFETVEAVDGNNAWDVLNKEPPFSLIVSDLTMPRMDGFGLLEKIRSSHLPHISNIPVIIITGANDSEATKQRATDVGATDFIGKPFDAVHLLARTQAHADAYATELSLTQETMELEDQALNDQVSGLPNETAFMERGYQQLAYAIRHKSGLALFCIDIDDFGDHFAQHGEEVTGAIIKSVAGVLTSCIRQEDMAARIGTARFALLLPGMNNAGIRNLADRIIKDVSKQQLDAGGSQLRFTVSIGVTASEIPGNIRFNSLLTSATSNLQAAISQGGNRVVHAVSVPDTPAPAQHKTESATANTSVVIPDIESASPQPVESLPEVMSGPLPDLEVVGTSEAVAASQEPVASSRSPFSLEDYEHEETIVITAPGEYHSPDEQDDTAVADSPFSATTADPAAETRSAGLLSRLWSLLTRKI